MSYVITCSHLPGICHGSFCSLFHVTSSFSNMEIISLRNSELSPGFMEKTQSFMPWFWNFVLNPSLWNCHSLSHCCKRNLVYPFIFKGFVFWTSAKLMFLVITDLIWNLQIFLLEVLNSNVKQTNRGELSYYERDNTVQMNLPLFLFGIYNLQKVDLFFEEQSIFPHNSMS